VVTQHACGFNVASTSDIALTLIPSHLATGEFPALKENTPIVLSLATPVQFFTFQSTPIDTDNVQV